MPQDFVTPRHLIDATPITCDELTALARSKAQFAFSPAALQRLQTDREVVQRYIDSGAPVYGLNTGLGGNLAYRVEASEVEAFQAQVIVGRMIGMGPPLPLDVVRAAQLTRHEYIDGEVFAMAGAEDRHVTVAGNLYITLRQHLRGSACRTYMSDMRLHLAAANSYFYPDVLVTCSALDQASAMVKSEPKLIVEVLSLTTAAYDRGLKFSHYRTLTSLEEYVLVDLDTRASDCYRKGADGLWVLHPFARGEVVELVSFALTLTAAQLFAEVAEG